MHTKKQVECHTSAHLSKCQQKQKCSDRPRGQVLISLLQLLDSSRWEASLIQIDFKMKIYVFLLSTFFLHTIASPVKRETKDDENQLKCKNVPKKQLEEVCHIEDVVVTTTNIVEQCKDVFITRCNEKFVHFPSRPFSSSRVLGTTSTLVASGVRVKHPFSKREDVSPSTQLQSTGKNCHQRKEKHCKNVPEVKTIPSEICENKNTTVYIDECEPKIEKDKVEISSEVPESSPVVGAQRIPSSGYMKIVLPLILLIIAVVFLVLWLLSFWMGISFIAALKIVLEPLRKGLGYVRFT